MNDITERNFLEGENLKNLVRTYNLHKEDNEVWKEFNINKRNIRKFINILKSLKDFPIMEIMDNGKDIETEEYRVYKCIEVGVNQYKLPVKLKYIFNIKEILKRNNSKRINKLEIPVKYKKVNLRKDIKDIYKHYMSDNFVYCDDYDLICKTYFKDERSYEGCFINHNNEYYINISNPTIMRIMKNNEEFNIMCRNFKKKFQLGVGLYIHGHGVGNGKTHLAYSILKEISKIKNVKHAYVPELFDKYSGSSFGEKENIINPFKNCDVLLLDDIGKERNSDHSDSFLLPLLEHRINNNLVTIFTSNKKISELGRSVSVMSRLVGSCDILELNGQDRRIKN